VNKIEPTVFDSWLRILTQVPKSVLWLYSDGNAAAESNLLRAASKRNVASERIMFARRVPHAMYLERLALADLFLDTWYYNAHTTCSDALWAGLPVVTLRGTTMASRVGASVLHAAGTLHSAP